MTTAGRACVIKWNGTPVSASEISGQGVEILELAIRDLGGIEHVTEDNIPYLRVEASAETPWSCVGPAMAAIERSGFAYTIIGLTDRPDAPDARVDFMLDPIAPEVPSNPSVIVRLSDHDMRWNNEAVELQEMIGRFAAISRRPAVSNDVVVIPSEGAPYIAFFGAAFAAQQSGVALALARCRVAASSGPTAAEESPPLHSVAC